MAQILIVDDEDVVCKTLKRLLEKDGIMAATVSSAEQALVVMAKDRFDLFIIDIKMPGMDGITLLNKVRSDAAYAETTVVICTGFAALETKDNALENGANYFIEKPFEAEDIIAAVKKGIGAGKD